MLDRLRKHASSWMTKLVLCLIILPFVVFFGYTSLSRQGRNDNLTVASVGEAGIPRKKFQMHYETSLKGMQEGLKGKLPENFEGFLRQNVLEQLILREVFSQYARSLGLDVSEEKVAEAIRSQKEIFPGGNFDLAVYENQFLPYYRQRYGEEYEDMMKREILIENLRSAAQALFSPWNEDLESSLKTMKSVPKSDPLKEPIHSLSPQELLALWVDDFREKVRIEYSDR